MRWRAACALWAVPELTSCSCTARMPAHVGCPAGSACACACPTWGPEAGGRPAGARSRLLRLPAQITSRYGTEANKAAVDFTVYGPDGNSVHKEDSVSETEIAGGRPQAALWGAVEARPAPHAAARTSAASSPEGGADTSGTRPSYGLHVPPQLLAVGGGPAERKCVHAGTRFMAASCGLNMPRSPTTCSDG